MSAVFLVESYSALIMLMAFIHFVALLAGKPVKSSLMGLRPVLFLAIFAVVINFFCVAGTPVTEHGFLSHISREGFGLAARMLLRLILLAGAASLLTYSTSTLSLSDGLARLLKPLERIGVPVHEIAMMLAMAMRFIPTILEEAARITRAQASRSAEFAGGTVLQRARSCMPLILPLFAGIFRRGDDLATAMEARCYRGNRGRTSMRSLMFSRADLTSAAVMAVFLTTLIYVEYARF